MGTWLLRGWMSTIRIEHQFLGPNVDPDYPRLAGRYIYAFWHENLLLPAYYYARPNVYVLISRHADGQLIAEVAERLGFRTVRGSRARGGTAALRELLRLSRAAHVAITPDGPRGPRRQVQPGMIYLAAQTGLPIVPVGIAYDRPWRAQSWDRFAVPRLWSRARSVVGEPIPVAATANRGQLEQTRAYVEYVMHELDQLAEQWVETGEWSEVRNQKSEVRSRKPEVHQNYWRAAG